MVESNGGSSFYPDQYGGVVNFYEPQFLKLLQLVEERRVEADAQFEDLISTLRTAEPQTPQLQAAETYLSEAKAAFKANESTSYVCELIQQAMNETSVPD